MKLRRWVARRKSDGFYSRVEEQMGDGENYDAGMATGYSKEIGDATFFRTSADAVAPGNDQWEAVQVFLTIDCVKKAKR